MWVKWLSKFTGNWGNSVRVFLTSPTVDLKVSKEKSSNNSPLLLLPHGFHISLCHALSGFTDLHCPLKIHSIQQYITGCRQVKNSSIVSLSPLWTQLVSKWAETDLVIRSIPIKIRFIINYIFFSSASHFCRLNLLLKFKKQIRIFIQLVICFKKASNHKKSKKKSVFLQRITPPYFQFEQHSCRTLIMEQDFPICLTH